MCVFGLACEINLAMWCIICSVLLSAMKPAKCSYTNKSQLCISPIISRGTATQYVGIVQLRCRFPFSDFTRSLHPPTLGILNEVLLSTIRLS